MKLIAVPCCVTFFIALTFCESTYGQSKQNEFELLRKQKLHDVEVRIIASSEYWEFRLAGADKKFGTKDDIVSKSEFKIPTNTVVKLTLKTEDINYRFVLKDSKVSTDIVVGRTVEIYIKGNKAGKYPVFGSKYLDDSKLEKVGKAILEKVK